MAPTRQAEQDDISGYTQKPNSQTATILQEQLPTATETSTAMELIHCFARRPAPPHRRRLRSSRALTLGFLVRFFTGARAFQSSSSPSIFLIRTCHPFSTGERRTESATASDMHEVEGAHDREEGRRVGSERGGPGSPLGTSCSLKVERGQCWRGKCEGRDKQCSERRNPRRLRRCDVSLPSSE
mgnify:CR=1 FL=1